MGKPKKKLIKIKTSQPSSKIPSSYKPFLDGIKKRIRAVQIKAAVTVNKELIKLYWSIGKDLIGRQKAEGWGSKLIEKFAKDLQLEFPGIEGFSRSNVFYMRSFYLAYEKVQQAAGQFENLPIFNIPWWHNVILFTKLKETRLRLWYAQQAIENGWSRNMLRLWIDSKLHERQGKSLNNFKTTLPQPQSDLAQESLKNTYVFDFLTLAKSAREKEIEEGLVSHIQQFLLELGQGFAFVGRQYQLRVENENYYIDMLFYHVKLRCYVVIELKARDFDPGDAGQINFYLSAVDDLLRHPDDQPTIGILLYYSDRKQKKITIEYALRDVKKPIGVAEMKTKIVESLPKQLKGSLPSVKELEHELMTVNIKK
ncbi:MAG TPA: PDDEXK nuclease domain-containing protein [Rhabdochlamydiaceae bacterium]|nr:PDDEXK nuclease domain-containing protein [Rhabdochlamydiaceae bacterium]